MVNSKNKGSTYERKIAKYLSSWWGGNFSRTPASGGLRWGTDNRIAGDIVAPPEADFPFVTELKNREGWLMEHILLDIGQPKEWLAQVISDARRVKRTPMLIFSRNRAKDFIMVPYTHWLYGQLNALQTYDVMQTKVTIKTIRDEVQVFDMIVTTLDTFTKVPIEDLKHYGKTVEWDAYADQYE